MGRLVIRWKGLEIRRVNIKRKHYGSESVRVCISTSRSKSHTGTLYNRFNFGGKLSTLIFLNVTHIFIGVVTRSSLNLSRLQIE